jgi:hypothetical protein
VVWSGGRFPLVAHFTIPGLLVVIGVLFLLNGLFREELRSGRTAAWQALSADVTAPSHLLQGRAHIAAAPLAADRCVDRQRDEAEGGREGITSVKSRKEIKRDYKERKKDAGVFQVKNTENGKVLLGSSLNLEGPLNAHQFMLMIGRHRNKALQKDWNEYGPDKFVFEILEVVKVKDDPSFNIEDELTLLEQIWLEKLQPFGERGYNTGSNIRQA